MSERRRQDTFPGAACSATLLGYRVEGAFKDLALAASVRDSGPSRRRERLLELI